ncbi:MAG: TetR/AcrR family transcriptional regulator [Candidatus Eremiobacteraeota bacterium]|nr:TetR/AcrR family transcriptional regulator [Candidatus Eremiobacteraeota bacterium]
MLRAGESGAKPAVEETRARIFRATRELYASKGSRGTTTREVSERAGVNEATGFRHFGTKQQLIAAMLDHYNSFDSYPHMLDRARTFPTVEEQLRELARDSIDAMKRKEDLIIVSMAEELANPDGHECAWRAPAEARLKLVAFFEEKVEAGEQHGDPQILARVFMSLFFSFVMARKLWADVNLPMERAVIAMVEIFMNGARVR